ncbi:MAG: LLM class F420-dependent oxidoreductase [Actinomycetales bacterium]
MRIGVHLVDFRFDGGAAEIGPTLSAAARAAEESGLDNLSVMDHYFQMEGMGLGDAQAPMLEAYTTLGFLAAETSTIELQALVTGATYRYPGLLAKIVTTLDVLSSGRSMLGIGAAWYEREHLGLGVPFPPTSERFARLEEILQIVRQMWSDNDGPYVGTYYQLAETICSPQPLTQPHPPIMIGGSGERKTLRLVAAYADACNLFAGPDTSAQDLKAKLDVLARHCADEGTDVNRIRKTILWVGPLDPGSPSQVTGFVERMKAYTEAGIKEVRVMPTADPVGFIQDFGSTVVPAISDL